MSWTGFKPKDVERSAILRTFSVNLEMTRGMEGLTMTKPAEVFKPALRHTGLVPDEPSSLATLLTRIAQNQLALGRQLSELDVWMNDHRLSGRTGRPDAIQ